MHPGPIANAVSNTFYDGKLSAVQKVKLKQKCSSYFGWIWNDHSGTEKSSVEECEDVVQLYKDLRRNKVKEEDIMIIAPYNSQAGLLREFIPSVKTRIGTVDILQGQEAKCVIISMTYGGDAKDNVEFVTDKHRMNVAISRAKEKVFIVASKTLQDSTKTSIEFKSLIKSKEIVFGQIKDFLSKSK
jgi:superfamily I DNA and/or RNA helicase